ncbi:MAG: site-2 protease family protein [Caldimicrobium sp.]|nr:site-2 protease family protein [Caldimicrobium sp.]MCX7613258.1 site-2 protease family protein [Caldimicrobium sp.]MDW8182059.1 site-2 protease family protein [Caldimicrobium sp.]
MWDLQIFILLLPVLLLSLTIHEFSHGLIAHLLGDPTPYKEGRLTLNPIKHLDIFGALALVLTQAIGWAKPVPINPNYFKNPWRDMALTSAAGPISNLLLATIFAFSYHLFQAFNLSLGSLKISEPLALISYLGVRVNLGLALFNFLPIPPLDGSKILVKFLPLSWRANYLRLELIGFFIILFLALTGILGITLYPILKFLANLLLNFTSILFK